jgi:hypothetical protein
MEDILIWLLKYWNVLTFIFNECRSEFSIKNDKKVLLKVWSILHLVHHIQIAPQRKKELVFFQVYLLLLHLHFGQLNPMNPLGIYDPSLPIDLMGKEAPDDGNPLDRLVPSAE